MKKRLFGAARQWSEVNHKATVGARGEDEAVRFLCGQGMQIIARNWRSKFGEIDIIARDGDEVVFVEVKTRVYSPLAAKYLFENITPAKKNKLEQLVSLFIARHYCRLSRFAIAPRTGTRSALPAYRLDLVGVLLGGENYSSVTIKHLKGAL